MREKEPKIKLEIKEGDKSIEKRKEEVINNIKEMVLSEKVCLHAPRFFFEEVIESEIEKNAIKREGSIVYKNERDIIDYCLKTAEEDKKESLGVLRKIFNKGLFSKAKMKPDILSRVPTPNYREFGWQEGSFFVGDQLAQFFQHYLKQHSDRQKLDYNSMLRNKDFKNKLREFFCERRKEVATRSKKQLSKDDLLDYIDTEITRLEKMYLNSKRAEFLFKQLKHKDLNDEERRKLVNTLFGWNLISSTPPSVIKQKYEKSGKLNAHWPEHGCFGILFKRPKKIQTHNLSIDRLGYMEFDLGIANAVYPKNFVAVVIHNERLKKTKEELTGRESGIMGGINFGNITDEQISKATGEVLSLVPKNLPVITSNFEVIRLPEQEEKKK